jgi:thymidylate synthase
MTIVRAQSLDNAWYNQLQEIMEYGRSTSPRGQLTKELPSKTLEFDMNRCVIINPERALGYKFMAAEAWWILTGQDDVATIAPYSKNISNFSDDGHKFFGAYGPRIVEQLDYVVAALMKDADTRQSVLTTWRPNPPETKDVPCTIAMDWLIRDNTLECHVFMRSSDNWLGIPYDAFNFSMLSCEILRRLNFNGPKSYQLGNCYLTAASSHLYERDFDAVNRVLDAGHVKGEDSKVPPQFYHSSVKGYVELQLEKLKDTSKGNPMRWWE